MKCLIPTLFMISASIQLYSIDDAKFKEVLKNFEVYAENQRIVWQVPGMAIGIVKGQEVVFAKGYGTRGLNDSRPVDVNTIFQIGSLSKAFTSALTAIAVDKGQLKWEDNVIDHLPSFRMADPWVTTQFQVKDLFAQRSGLPPYAGDTQAFLGFTRDDIIQNLRYLKPVSSFRAQFAYQNLFFLVGGSILEQKSNNSYEALLKTEIFQPLGMNNTTTSVKDYLKAGNRAEWLMRLKDGSTMVLKEDFSFRNWNYLLGPAGGINSNISDMTKWLILHANQGKYQDKELITKANMQKMIRPMVFVGAPYGSDMYYALGWIYADYSPYPIIWHDGATLGVYNVAAFIPEENLGIVILSNVRNTRLSYALAQQFFDMYFDKPDQNWSQKLLAKAKEVTAEVNITNPYPPQPLSNYIGKYHNFVYGDVVVKEEKSALVLIIGKNNLKLSMQPWDRDIFSLTWPIVEDEATKVVFLPDDNGKITKMQIEIFIKEGSGEFERVQEKGS